MTKYIIELDDDIKYLIINGRADNRCYTLVRPVEELEILNSDYINEHYGKLQDEAYQKGLEDAWEATKKIFGYEIDGAIPIADIGNVFGYEPCKAFCTADILRDFTAQEAIDKLKAYEDKQKAEDEIKVGDEVISLRKNGEVIEDISPWIVTYETKYAYQGFDACGMFHNNPKEMVRKTGKHYDIASILEAMKS